MDDVVKCLVFMADLSERPQLNEVYASFFPNHKPARSAVGVDLNGPLVEIECIAILPDAYACARSPAPRDVRVAPGSLHGLLGSGSPPT